MRFQPQGTAAADPDIPANVRKGIMENIDTVIKLTGAAPTQVAEIVGRTLDPNVGAILDLPARYLPASAQ